MTKQLNKNEITEEKASEMRAKYDTDFKVLEEYKKIIRKQKKGKKGSGLTFYNDPQDLLKKLEIIISEIIAGYISRKMKNTAVSILDTLLKTKIINKSQHEKLYKNYFNTSNK